MAGEKMASFLKLKHETSINAVLDGKKTSMYTAPSSLRPLPSIYCNGI